MKKFNKGLSSNTRPHEQPESTVPFSKNGIILDGVPRNEPGFILSAAIIPYTPIGVIETDKFPVIISTDNTNTAVGYYDADNDRYTPIANDATYTYKLGLSTNFPVNGQSQRNYKGEIIIVFTDFNTFPKFLNCDVPVINALDDWRLFPRASTPDLTTNIIDGGTLAPGGYYILGKCIKNDGTETQYLVTSDALIIPGATNTNSGKSIQAVFTNLDPNYNFLQVAIISKINGVTSAVTLEPVRIGTGNRVSIIYTGANLTTTATLEELLVQPAEYSKVKTIGQLNDALYLGNLEREEEILLQKYMLLAKLEFVSELISVLPRNEDHVSGKKKSFMHREVYAFYIRLSKAGGSGWTPLFTIPGPEPLTSDFDQESEALYGGGLPATVYQTSDTIRTFNASAKTGICGVWVNANETYPDTDDYDASTIGGINLRNRVVQHHRMPSIRWCKQNLYANNSNYGKSQLDLLGIQVSNIIIPAQFQNRLDGGYEIYYAKRSISNSTVVAQSALLYAARHGTGSGTRVITGPDTDYKTTGGNWHAQVDWDGGTREKPLVIDLKLFRFHAFDLLFNQPAIAPKFVAQELLLHRSNMPMIEDFTITGGKRNGPISYLIDYVKDGSPPIAPEAGTVIRRIADTAGDLPQYVPNNLVSGKWYNVMAEKVYAGKLLGPEMLDGSDIAYSNLWTGPNAEKPNEAAQFETCYLSNLMNLPSDIYLPFNAQSVVRVAPRQTGNTPMFGGDVFICDYSFNTYGWHDYQNSTYSEDPTRDPFMGIKTARRILCESASNIYNRFEIVGNIYSKWYPNSPLEKDDANQYLNLFDRRIEPNQFGYTKDSNALNDIIAVTMFDPLAEDLRVFPFRIHRSGKLNRQLKIRSWRSFLPLDYYELQKNMGVIEHIEGMDDRLLIHCTNALFYTHPKLNLEQGSLAVVIGNGDIFDFEPQEPYSDKLGYAGTQHNLACYRTPAGYIFTDVTHGEIYLFKNQLKLMTEGIDIFLRDHLTVKENNPFIGNGITIGYDQEFKRIILTCKNLILPAGVKPLEKTQSFIDSLTPGESLVTDSNRLMRFLGVSADYQCTELVPVIVGDIILTIPENTSVGTVIHTIVPISGIQLSYYAISGNLDNAISIEAATGKIKISNQAGIDYEIRHQLVIQAKAISTNTLSDTFTITINITNVQEPPTTGPQQFTIPENSPNSTIVGSVPAQGQGSLSYSIIEGNDAGVFTISSVTGQITVADNSTLNFELTPLYLLQVNVSNGVSSAQAPVTINITNIDEPPPLNDDTITIYDTTPTGTIVYQFITEDPEGATDLVFEIVNASTPGVFTLDTVTGEVKLVNNSYLNPGTTPQYTLTVRVKDPNQNSDEGTLTINVLSDPETLDFRPSSSSCSGGCPEGYDQTDDGLYCEKLTVIAATPPTSGDPFGVAPAKNGAYSNFGAIVYQPGYNGHGVGTIQNWLQQDIWRNFTNSLELGPLNRSGVWSSSPVPDNEQIGFSIPVVFTETTDVFIAIAGDNKCRIAIDGVTLVDQDPVEIGDSLEAQLPLFAGQGIALAFKFWHVYPFRIQAGSHYIGLEGINFGSAAGFGAEIYKNTVTELQNATLKSAYVSDPDGFPLDQNYYNDLDLLFTTRSTRGGTFSSGISGGYSCPIGYALDGTAIPTPTCVLVERLPSTTRIWSATQVYSLRLGQVLTTLPNLPGQSYQGLPVPYFPPIPDHVACGGTKTVYYSIPKAASVTKSDCTEGVGSVVKYAVPGGMYTSLESQVDADNQAIADVNTNKQQYANDNGFCINRE
jgi:hypothetical protein